MRSEVSCKLQELLWSCLDLSSEHIPASQLQPHILTMSEIFEHSKGPVRKPEMVNKRTQRPEPDGLFCEKLFGPIDTEPDNEAPAHMGHIALAHPLIHPWFLYRNTTCLPEFTGLSIETLRKLSRLEVFLVQDSQLMEVLDGEVVSLETHNKLIHEHGEGALSVLAGAHALRWLLEQRGHPTSMIVEALFVLPPDLRPLSPDDVTKMHDVNQHYRRVINRNNRLSRLQELKAPEIIILNEIRMLQESYESLIDNGCNGKITYGPHKHHLQGLQQMLDSFWAEVESDEELSLSDSWQIETPDLLGYPLPIGLHHWIHYLAATGISIQPKP